MKRFFWIACCFLMVNMAQAQQGETRNVGSFDAIHVGSSFDVELSKGRNESVRLDISGIDLDEIKTEVNNGTLKIYRKNKGRNWSKNIRGKIYVTYRNLEEIRSSGSADLYCHDPLEARHFDLSVSGSGNVILDNLKAEDLRSSISGSSDMEVAGNVGSQEVTISGSGNYDARDLDCQETRVRVSGSGNAYIVAHESLSASVSGSGNVSYKGSPEHHSTSTSGSGSVRRMR